MGAQVAPCRWVAVTKTRSCGGFLLLASRGGQARREASPQLGLWEWAQRGPGCRQAHGAVASGGDSSLSRAATTLGANPLESQSGSGRALRIGPTSRL